MPKVSFKRAGEREKFLNRVLDQSMATYGAFAVLEAMCRRSDFRCNEVTITAPQLVRSARRCDRTVRDAWRFLKAEGTIKPVRGADGGRGVAVTFQLNPLGGYEDETAPQTDLAALYARMRELEDENPRATTMQLKQMAKAEGFDVSTL